jgi:beta-mannanase
MIAWLPRPSTAQADPHRLQPQYANAAIAAGRQDAYIRAFARSLAAFHGTVLLRYAPEFDGKWEPWHDDHAAYVSAWRRIHRIFQEEGAVNVKFVWSPSLPWANYNGGFQGWLRLVRKYWPGSDVVDYVGTTTVSHNGQPVAFFAERIPLLREFGKPVVLGEVYAPRWLRGRWLPEFAQMVDSMPYVRVVVWCDLNPKLPVTSSPGRAALSTIDHAGT